MKRIKYPIYQSTLESGEVITFPKDIPWSESNWKLAKEEAYGVEPKIYDDGEPEPPVQETTDDVLNALLGVTV